MTAVPASHASVPHFLSGLGLAPRQAHKLLTVWPLVRTEEGEPAGPPYTGLADALEAGTLRVGELEEGASVPHVLVDNRGGQAVLLLFGEEIRGALQNRIANASYLVAPGSRVRIDVSCVEAGRWGRRSGARRAGFEATREVISHSLRQKLGQRVRLSSAGGGGFHGDQGEVWDEVRTRLSSSGTRSATSAYSDYVGSRRTDLAEAGRAFHPVPGQVGFVAAIGDEIVGLEAIGRTEVFAESFPGLLRSYLVDAIDAAALRQRRAPGPVAPGFDAPEAFLEALVRAPARTGPSLDLGLDVRLEGERVSGCALVEGDVVHLTAFTKEEQ